MVSLQYSVVLFASYDLKCPLEEGSTEFVGLCVVRLSYTGSIVPLVEDQNCLHKGVCPWYFSRGFSYNTCFLRARPYTDAMGLTIFQPISRAPLVNVCDNEGRTVVLG